MNKILITGAKGQLGNDCVKILSPDYRVTATDVNELDICNFYAVDEIISSIRPDFIINCAAYTAVDQCEIEKELSWKINAKGPEYLASAAKKTGSILIHISTDYVFDGKKNYPESYTENDSPNPLSWYGKSKWEGELAAQHFGNNHIIVRTAWLYGITGRNFLKTMLKLSQENPSKILKVVNDQFGSFTWSHRLALQIKKLIENNCSGTFHATAEGFATWYEGAKYFLKKMGQAHNIFPCKTEEYPTLALRPQNSILENMRLKKHNLNIMESWQRDIDNFVNQLKGLK